MFCNFRSISDDSGRISLTLSQQLNVQTCGKHLLEHDGVQRHSTSSISENMRDLEY
jgi:hypothetical protein